MTDRKTLHNALPILCAAYSQKVGVPIVISGQSAYTDGNTIVIPNIPESWGNYDALWGYLAHESAHVRLTDWDVVPTKKGLVHSMFNITEDCRIERAMIKLYPGMSHTLNEVARYMSRAGHYAIPNEQTHPVIILEAYCLYYLQTRYVGQQAIEHELRETEKVFKTVFPQAVYVRLQSLFRRVPDMETSQDAMDLTMAILSMLQDEANKAPENPSLNPPKPQVGDNGQKGNDPKGDDSGSSQGNGQKGDDPKGDDSGASQGNGQKGDDPKGDDSGASQGNDQKGDDSKGDDSGASQGNGQNGDDPQDDDSGASQGDGQKGDDPKGDDSGASQGNDQKGDDPKGDDSGASQGDGQEGDDPKGDGPQGDDSGASQGNGQKGDDPKGDDSGASKGNGQKGDGSGASQGNSQKGGGPKGDDSGDSQGNGQKAVIRALGAGEDDHLHDAFDRFRSDLESSSDSEPPLCTKIHMPGDAHSMGGQLASDLKQRTRLVSTAIRSQLMGLVQSAKRSSVRTVRSGGRLSGKHLSRLRRGDTRVFQKRTEHEQPNTAVHLLVDMSRSMVVGESTERPPYVVANEAALALAMGLEAIPGVNPAVTYFSGGYQPLLAAVKHQKSVTRNVDRFSAIPRGTTPMAEAVWYAGFELLQQKEPRKLIIIVTDGDPDSGSAMKDVVQRCQGSNIELIGIGIESNAITEFLSNSVVINNVEELQSTLFSLIGKSLLRAS
ncbi:VWA domain-containing protein [Halomonas sp. 86]|uniref:VWA domain-containing protein n=1 Tax=unclassified Halomonas TaxID=2609666 RepID=UPI00403492AD